MIDHQLVDPFRAETSAIEIRMVDPCCDPIRSLVSAIIRERDRHDPDWTGMGTRSGLCHRMSHV